MGETSYLAARAEQRGAWREVVHMPRDMVMGQRAGWRLKVAAGGRWPPARPLPSTHVGAALVMRGEAL